MQRRRRSIFPRRRIEIYLTHNSNIDSIGPSFSKSESAETEKGDEWQIYDLTRDRNLNFLGSLYLKKKEKKTKERERKTRICLSGHELNGWPGVARTTMTTPLQPTPTRLKPTFTYNGQLQPLHGLKDRWVTGYLVALVGKAGTPISKLRPGFWRVALLGYCSSFSYIPRRGGGI